MQAGSDITEDPKSSAQRFGCLAGDAIFGASFGGGVIHREYSGVSKRGPWLSTRTRVGVLFGPDNDRIRRITPCWSLQEFAATRRSGAWSYGGERISRGISDPRDLG